MPSTTTLVIGAGHAGLAMSRCLTDRSIDHVILERGSVANTWRTERWDSLRLLTPNWQTRLPGWQYAGPDPEGYMNMPEVIRYLQGYADSFDAPVQDRTTVESVRPMGGGYPGYEVRTDQGTWYARSVVIATGACSTPAIPDAADGLDGDVHQLSPIHYRNPTQLPEGGVLVVGASASGIQLADELNRAGRDVTLAVGRHTRLPRTYRGMDTQWWLDFAGILDRHYTQVADIDQARRAPSLQIVGTPDHRTLDLATIKAAGVRLTGRLEDCDGAKVGFADDLDRTTGDADRALARLLVRLDEAATRGGLDHEVGAPTRLPAFDAPATPARIDLRSEGIGTIIWATGFRPHYPWLHTPVFGPDGQIRHDGGVVHDAPGLYVMGLPFMRRRRSTFIDGAGADARDLTRHITTHLDRTPLVV